MKTYDKKTREGIRQTNLYSFTYECFFRLFLADTTRNIIGKLKVLFY